jgi:hypothetical protein
MERVRIIDVYPGYGPFPKHECHTCKKPMNIYAGGYFYRDKDKVCCSKPCADKYKLEGKLLEQP